MDVNGPNAQELFERLQEFMNRCSKLLDENIEPDLTGMDAQVAELTDTIHDLKFDQLQQIQPALQGLMDQLMDLENKLKSQRDKVRDSIQSVGAHKQAHSAYQRMQSNAPKTSDTPNTSDDEGDQS